MDIPDKIFDEAKLWQFKAVVVPTIDQTMGYMVSPHLPVKDSSDKTIGACTLSFEHNSIVGYFDVDYGIAERLDVEIGANVWAVPETILYPYRDPPLEVITAIVLRRTTNRSGHAPIGVEL